MMKILECYKLDESGYKHYILEIDDRNYTYWVDYKYNYTVFQTNAQRGFFNFKSSRINCIIPMNESNPKETIDRFHKLLILK